jgi:hypothetical protein
VQFQFAGQSPHVVRGTSRKRQYVSDVTETGNPDGSTTKRTVLSERIELVVRTVDHTGIIQTFMDTDRETLIEPEQQGGNYADTAGTDGS